MGCFMIVFCACKLWGLKISDVFLLLLWANIKMISFMWSDNQSGLQGVEYTETQCLVCIYCLLQNLCELQQLRKYVGLCGGAVGCTALQAGRSRVRFPMVSRVRFPMVSLEFFIGILRPHYGPGVDSASNRNEYQ
jgi:hypothetical protein